MPRVGVVDSSYPVKELTSAPIPWQPLFRDTLEFITQRRERLTFPYYIKPYLFFDLRQFTVEFPYIGYRFIVYRRDDVA